MGDSQNHMYTYVVFEVGGIQNYILGTGRMKEMIGGSELVESLSKSFLQKAITEFVSHGTKFIPFETADGARPPENSEILIVQRNAGNIHLIFSNHDDAKAFVTFFSKKVLERFSGLPFFGALDDELEWNAKSFSECRSRLSSMIQRQRNIVSTNAGSGMFPIFQRAPADGEPAVAFIMTGADRNGVFVSEASKARMADSLIKDSDRRLRLNNASGEDSSEFEAYKNRFNSSLSSLQSDEGQGKDLNWDDIEWPKDLGELTGGQGKIAFIHMDGNDFGKMFNTELEREIDVGTPEEQLSQKLTVMGALSRSVSSCSRKAYARAIEAIIPYCHFVSNRPVMPFRPLVLGGDDITVIIRADLALIFVDAFEKGFEQASAEIAQGSDGKRVLTLGMGMLVASSGFPFLKAFELIEDLAGKAKQITVSNKPDAFRPGSIDYLVVTNEIENDLDALRGRTEIARDKSVLSTKPFILEPYNPANLDRIPAGATLLPDFVKKGVRVLTSLARSQVRGAAAACREGAVYSQKYFDQLKANLHTATGGRMNKSLMSDAELDEIFPEGGFFINGADGKKRCALYDYLELAHLSEVGCSSLSSYFGGKHD